MDLESRSPGTRTTGIGESEMRLEVVYSLKSQNFYMRKHWSYRRRAIDELADLFFVARKEAGLPAAEGKRHLRFTFVFPTRRTRDVDNYSGKILRDSLVRSGVIVDDSPEWIKVEEATFKIAPGKQRILVDVLDFCPGEC